jgi:hypothetical protein
MATETGCHELRYVAVVLRDETVLIVGGTQGHTLLGSRNLPRSGSLIPCKIEFGLDAAAHFLWLHPVPLMLSLYRRSLSNSFTLLLHSQASAVHFGTASATCRSKGQPLAR